MFFIYLLLTLSVSLDFEEKEEVCYLLSTASVAKRHNEAYEHAKSKEDMHLGELRPKLLEDTFNYCIENLTEDLALKVLNDRTHANENSHIFNIDLDRYKTKNDVKSEKNFDNMRKRMALRLASRKNKQEI